MNDGLIGLWASEQTKMEFEIMKLKNFWCIPLAPFPQLSDSAGEPVSTVLCEVRFSSLLHI